MNQKELEAAYAAFNVGTHYVAACEDRIQGWLENNEGELKNEIDEL